MKQQRYMISLLLLTVFCWQPIMAQSDIEITDSTSTEWGDYIGGGLLPNLPTDPVTSLTLSMTDITLDGGDRFRLTAQTNSTAANKAVTWSVADKKIAIVSNNGTVTGLKKGTTTVTATSVSNPEVSASCKVTVISDYVAPPSGWILPWGKEEAWTMKYKFFEQANYVEPSNDIFGRSWKDLNYDDTSWETLTGPMGRSDNCNYYWEGENNCFCLRRTFFIPVVGNGFYKLYANHDDGIEVYMNGKLVAEYNDWTQDQDVVYPIPNEALTAGDNQLAIYIKQGGGGACLDYGLYYESIEPVTELALSSSELTLKMGEYAVLTATANESAYNKSVTWSVANSAVATVSPSGRVKGVKTGTTIVTATSVSNPEVSANCKVTVTSEYAEPNLIVNTDGNGVVTGGGTYTEGTEVTLVAIPNDGHRFVKWSDGSTANPYTFILYGTTELMAFFEPIEGEGLGNGRIVSIPGGDYNVFYSDYTGKRWYLNAADYANWAVSETPKTIKFTAGNVTDGQAFSNAASFMESNGYYMSNVEGWDGTGPINTVPVNEGLGLEKRTWESQVFYKNNEEKYAIRLTNTVGMDWGCHLFVNIDPVTLEVAADNPSLGDALYLWEIEEVHYYNVYYYVGEELVHTVEVAYGEAIPEYIYEPTEEGYSFSGWIGLPETMPANDVTVTGSFTVNKYLVTFKIGDEVVASYSLEYGATIVVPAAPEKVGYTFTGWGDVAETVPAGDLTYEGSYTVNSYLLTYMVDGEVFHTSSIAYGTSLTALAAPVKEGHTFSGWIGLPETMPANDVTVTGSFTVNKYLVTFKIGDEVVASYSLEYGATIVVPAAPEKVGYTFTGWGDVAEIVPAGDLTYEGSYTVNSYLLTYMVDGEVFHTSSIAYGTSLTALAAPVKEGHTFSGWIGLPETMPANDVTVTGSFTVNKYLVVFKIGDEVIASDSLEYGATIVVPEVTECEGYTFDGWGDVAATVPACDVTYEGSYTANIYKVYYYVGEELVHTDEVTYGEAMPEYIYEPTEEGYTFLGWLGETYETMPAHDVTYRANITNDVLQLKIGKSRLTIYDLAGRTVLNTENLKGGVYIVNGKKVVVK